MDQSNLLLQPNWGRKKLPVHVGQKTVNKFK